MLHPHPEVRALASLKGGMADTWATPFETIATQSLRVRRDGGSNPFQNNRNSLTHTDAHGAQRILPAALVQLLGRRHGKPGT